MSKARSARPGKIWARLKQDLFLPALVIVVLLAIAWPQPGVSGGILHADKAATYGVAIIFFLYGISLETRRLLESATRWRQHLVVQIATFGLFPLLVALALPLFGGALPDPVAVGFFFLAALPSTVSSSVAMTSLANGNVPVAIFNASISSLIGVFLTPLLMAWYLSASGGMELGDVIMKLVQLVIMPLVAGQVLRPLLLKWIHRHKGIIKWVDRGVILAIVYNSFCDSMEAGVWSGQSPLLLVEIVVGSLALFFVVYGIVGVVCKLMGFDVADTIAVQFCASKKSLAAGLPMARVMFGGSPQLSLIITPIMIFHFLQLVIVSVIANRYAQRRPEG